MALSRYAVLGQPIAHSRSPQIHQWFAEAAGIALEYERIEVSPADFAATLARLATEGYRGLNVTSPHKLAALESAVSKTPRAELAGAANTLSAVGGGWRADTTDGEGLLRDLTANLGIPVAGQRVLLLGAGGAARSVLKALLDEKPRALTLSSRTPWRVEKLAADFRTHGPIRPATHQALKGDTYDLVINATTAGYAGETPRLPERLLAPQAACYDMVYGKAFEPFRGWAIQAGASRISDGLGMLVEQAASAFALWHGVRPETKAVIHRLRAAN